MHSTLTKILPPTTYDFSITSSAPKCTAPYSRRNVCFQLSLNFYWIYPRLYLSVTGSTSSISTLNLSLKQNLSDFSLEYQICIFPLKSKLLFHDVNMEEVVVVRRGQGRQLHHEFWPAPDSSSPFRFDFFVFLFVLCSPRVRVMFSLGNRRGGGGPALAPPEVLVVVFLIHVYSLCVMFFLFWSGSLLLVVNTTDQWWRCWLVWCLRRSSLGWWWLWRLRVGCGGGSNGSQMDVGVGSPTLTHGMCDVLIGGSGGGVLSRRWSIPSLCLRD
jgi:hypothetical protein